jgi:hypothetical protein
MALQDDMKEVFSVFPAEFPEEKEVRFTEMLKESGSGLSSGGFDHDSPSGFGFKKGTYKTGMGGSGRFDRRAVEPLRQQIQLQIRL